MLIVASLALLLTAEAAPAAAVAPAKETDPLVCERQGEPGSLVKKKRVCMRKSEWAARRRDDRMAIERTQINKGTIGN